MFSWRLQNETTIAIQPKIWENVQLWLSWFCKEESLLSTQERVSIQQELYFNVFTIPKKVT